MAIILSKLSLILPKKSSIIISLYGPLFRLGFTQYPQKAVLNGLESPLVDIPTLIAGLGEKNVDDPRNQVVGAYHLFRLGLDERLKLLKPPNDNHAVLARQDLQDSPNGQPTFAEGLEKLISVIDAVDGKDAPFGEVADVELSWQN